MSRPCIGHTAKSVLVLVQDGGPGGYAFYSFDPNLLQNTVSQASSVQARQVSAQPTDGFVYGGVCSFDEETGYFALYGATNQDEYVIRELLIHDSDQVDVVSNISITHTLHFSSLARINVSPSSSGSCYAAWQLGWPSNLDDGNSGNIMVYCSSSKASSFVVPSESDLRTKNAWLLPYSDNSLIMIGYPNVTTAYAYNTTSLHSNPTTTLQLPFSPASDALILASPQQDRILYVSFSTKQAYQFSASSLLSVAAPSAPASVTINTTSNALKSNHTSFSNVISRRMLREKRQPHRITNLIKRQISAPSNESSQSSSPGDSNLQAAQLPSDVSSLGDSASVAILATTLPGLRSVSSGGSVALFLRYDGNGNFMQYNQDTSSFFSDTPKTENPSTPLSNTSNSGSSSRLGAIIGGVIGGVVVLALLVTLIVILLRRRKRKGSQLRLTSVDQHFLPEKERALAVAAAEPDDAFLAHPLNEEHIETHSFAGNPHIKLLSYPAGSSELLDLNPDAPGERRILQSEYYLENALPVQAACSTSRFSMFQPISKAAAEDTEPGSNRRMIHYYREDHEDAFVRAVVATTTVQTERIIQHYTAYALEHPTPAQDGYKFMWITSPFHVTRTLAVTLFEKRDQAVLGDDAFKEYATASLILSVRDLHRERIAHMGLSPFVYYCEKASAVLKWRLSGFEQSAAFGSTIPKPRLSAYSAPELWRSPTSTCKADAAADIWSLGCILYSIATSGERLLADPRTPPADWEGTVKAALQGISASQPEFHSLLQDMLSFNPSYRPTAEEIARRWTACNEEDDDDEEED